MTRKIKGENQDRERAASWISVEVADATTIVSTQSVGLEISSQPDQAGKKYISGKKKHQMLLVPLDTRK